MGQRKVEIEEMGETIGGSIKDVQGVKNEGETTR